MHLDSLIESLSRRLAPALPQWRAWVMKRFALSLFLGLSAFLGGMAATWLGSRSAPTAFAQSTAPDATRPAESVDPLRVSDRFEAVARKFAPSVVAIEAVKPTVKDGKARSVDDSGSGVLA